MNIKLRRGVLAAAITLGATLGVASAAAAVNGPATTAARAPAPVERITVAEPVALNAPASTEPTTTTTATTSTTEPVTTEPAATEPTATKPAARGVLTATATDLVYGQPGLRGTRGGSNTVTLTNSGTARVEFPVLTFPSNGRDFLLHAEVTGCPYMSGGSAGITCVLEPLAAGESRVLTLPWQTQQASGPATTFRARLAQGADREGAPITGTASTVTWQVSLEKLTGTFTIEATPLVYSAPDQADIRYGSTRVTIENLSAETVRFPTVTFQANGADATFADWTGCVRTFHRDYDAACVEAPLAPGEKRTLEFQFSVTGSMTENDAAVRVEAATDATGTVIPGTAVGAGYTVTSPSDEH